MPDVHVPVISPISDEEVYDAVMGGRFEALMTLLACLVQTDDKDTMSELLSDHMRFLNATDLMLAGNMKAAEKVAETFKNGAPMFFMGKPGSD